MSTPPIPQPTSDNPFLQPGEATASAPASNDNPFVVGDSGGGEAINDIGKTVIVPKDDESFADTMQRAAAHGKNVTQQDISDEMRTAPAKVAETVAAAPLIGATGAAVDAGATTAIKGAAGAVKAVGNMPKIAQGVRYIGQAWSKLPPLAKFAAYTALAQTGVFNKFNEVERTFLQMMAFGAFQGGPEGEAAAGEAESEQAAAPEEGAEKPVVQPSTLPNKDTAAAEEENPGVPGPTEEREAAQKAIDKYYADHPEKRPTAQTVKRGAKKGQPRMTRVFKDGQWHEVPVYK